MSRIVTSLLVAAVSCGLSFAQARSDVRVLVLNYRTDVRVLVLNYRTGHPVKGWEVGLHTGTGWVVGRTAKTGEAVFRIFDPVPQTLSIDPEAGGWSAWSCTQEYSFQTSEVLQTGIAGKVFNHPFCRTHISSTAAHAGEIVIYVRRLNPWLTFRRVLWETFYG
ncbi:MAG TPA: hypothetical protein VNX88_15265 [Terriglobales bacterium]|nr:hypothetical protein [Terriglobales bacterium]